MVGPDCRIIICPRTSVFFLGCLDNFSFLARSGSKYVRVTYKTCVQCQSMSSWVIYLRDVFLKLSWTGKVSWQFGLNEAGLDTKLVCRTKQLFPIGLFTKLAIFHFTSNSFVTWFFSLCGHFHTQKIICKNEKCLNKTSFDISGETRWNDSWRRWKCTVRVATSFLVCLDFSLPRTNGLKNLQSQVSQKWGHRYVCS